MSEFVVGQQVFAEVRYKNIGDADARQVRGEHGIELVEWSQTNKCPSVTLTPTGDDVASSSPVAIGGEINGTPFSHGVLSAAHIAQIQAGTASLFVYSKQVYGSDGKTTPYITEFYGRWNPKKGAFDLCQSNNDAN